MTVFFSLIVARNHVAVTPREAIISEPVDVIVDQPTVPLVLTYHPTNTLVTSVLTRNLHLLRNDPDTTAIFQTLHILSAYRRDSNLRDSLVRSTRHDTTIVDDDRGTFPCGISRCNTCTHTNVPAFVDSPGERITISDKFTCTSNNVVYVIKYRAFNKLYIGETCRRLGDRFREHLRSTRTCNTDLQLHAILHYLATPLRTRPPKHLGQTPF